MKAIMISIKPKYVADILNGEKTLEIRKTIPKCDLPIDVYIYCTKDRVPLIKLVSLFGNSVKYDIDLPRNYNFYKSVGNGKVVAKFTLNKVERLYEYQVDGYGSDYEIASDTLKQEELLKECCLTYEQLSDYLGDINNGYAWHIDNLVPFDKPKEIKEFVKVGFEKIRYKTIRESEMKKYLLTKAPQSFMFIEV